MTRGEILDFIVTESNYEALIKFTQDDGFKVYSRKNQEKPSITLWGCKVIVDENYYDIDLIPEDELKNILILKLEEENKIE